VADDADVRGVGSAFVVGPNPGEEDATPAATVAVLRDAGAGPEVLMVRRNTRGSFAGMWVFPGGRVDDEDAVGDEGEIAVAARTAAREAEEEAGLRLDPGALVALSWWLPPMEAARRFATWFFLAEATGAEVTVDDTEVHEHRWLTPRSAMALRDRGEIQLAPPTWTTLHWLASRPSAAAALADAAAREPERYVTRLVMGPGPSLRATVWEGDAAYADGDLERPGPRRRLLADEPEWRFEGTQT
jgi:8-oxo-dGTP pyrophosphatase MutT (NUDIX family)